MKKNLLLLTIFVTTILISFSQPIYNKAGIRLYKTPSQEEIEWAKSQGYDMLRTTPTPPPVGQLRPVAEWEPAEAVLIAYPLGIPVSLIKEMAKDIKVITIVAGTLQQNTALNYYNSNGVNTANCEFLVAPSDSYWTRDYGPWFMAIDNSKMAMYDFTYNRPRYNDNLINGELAPFLSSNGPNIDRYASTLLHCGGNYMADGTSQAASTTLVLEENYMTTPQIKQHYLEYMGIEEYHFTEDPLQDYIKHIDCWGKYLAPNKVMLGQVPSTDPRYGLFEAAANYFASLTSPYGTPMQVFRVPTPGASNWSSPATPYTNSLILNNKVFVPQTGHANDAAAIQAYKNAMPGYEVIGIYYDYWIDTDAIHCRTHEIADRCMLYIKHQPDYEDMVNIGVLNFGMELYSYCNHTIYQDSVIVYLRVDGGEYAAYNMEYLGDNKWAINICGLPGGLIEYYVFAADESGRRERHPYIGGDDPHKFNLIGTPPPVPVLSLDKTSSSVYSDVVTIVEDYITISNTCSGDLIFEITDIEITDSSTGMNSNEMLTIDPQSGTVPAGESLTITLSYNFHNAAKLVKPYTGSFKITSNDLINPEVEITLYVAVHVGINEMSVSDVTIYPNPTTGELTIESGKSEIENVEIFDIVGKKQLSYHFISSSSHHNINISHLNNGVYFAKITNNLGQSVVKKIVKF
jgi:agmatine/peptidylarginine deiminase